MRRRTWRGLSALLVLGLAVSASAQESTEIYVPIGRSPGVSGVSSEVGRVVALDRATRTLVLRNAAGERTAQLGPTTPIWLDRSGVGLPNRTGSLADCRAGARVEVRLASESPRSTPQALWVKVEATE
jgi:hypothetical protein